MNCAQARSLFSLYLDGTVTGAQMALVGEHLKSCGSCSSHYQSLRRTQQLLASVPREKAPANLALKLRLAISRESARPRRAYLRTSWVHWENALNAFMVPAAVGLLTAVAIFGCLMGYLTLPLQNSSNDVPLLLSTAPRLQQSAFGSTLDSIDEDPLVIEAYVGSNGRLEDYRVLSNPEAPRELPAQVKNMLIFTTFRPATSMGRPIAGRAVLSFSKISVKG